MSLVSPCHAVVEFAQRTAQTRSVVSCPHVIPNRTLRAALEILPRSAPLLSGAQSPSQDHRRNGRQLHRLSPLSCAKLQPINRRHNASTRWPAAAKPLLPAAYLLLSPTTGHLPILLPLTTSGSGEVSGDRPRGARQT